jgi:Flp pilus assembly protein TadG
MPQVLKQNMIKDQKGAVVAIVAVCLVIFVGFTALAVDIGHLYVVRNELQNAADAGALAGARRLFIDDGSINPAANTFATSAAADNMSENLAVEVPLVERGHWSFATNTFTPNDSLDQTDLWDVSMEELDANPAFINAVRVTTQRSATPAALYFAQIFSGAVSQAMETRAVAYIGFAGNLNPADLDEPIAICEEKILNDEGEYTCNVGRMINSGGNADTANTGAWTNFTQPCETASVPSVRPLICGDGNPNALFFGSGMGSVNGMQDNLFRDFEDCWWRESNNGTRPWPITLPVISCPSNAISNCAKLLGAVEVNVMWVHRDNQCDDNAQHGYPTTMSGTPDGKYGAWTSPNPADAAASWASFFSHFHLQNVNDQPATCDFKSVYFLPDCNVHEPSGTSGGKNYSILAKIPVLVN